MSRKLSSMITLAIIFAFAFLYLMSRIETVNIRQDELEERQDDLEWRLERES